MDLDKATDLARETGYAAAANQDYSKINWADAGAFFLEGYEYAKKTSTAFARLKAVHAKLQDGLSIPDQYSQPCVDEYIKELLAICEGHKPDRRHQCTVQK